MIKRRFYRQDRGDRADGSDSSSSDSDSEVEAQISDASEDEVGDEAEVEVVDHDQGLSDDRFNLQMPSSSSSSSAGDESEDRSDDELDEGSSGTNEKAVMLETLAKDLSLPDDVAKWILKSKSVFKCRLCPKIVCLNEESLKTHFNSKRHTRSEKLLSNGKLKHMLNSDGEEEVLDEDGETHTERHARILALSQHTSCKEEPKKKSRGRQRQRLRRKRKKEEKGTPTKETSQKVKKQRQNV